LETLFNAACLNLIIILIFNFKNFSISEMDSMVLPFGLEKFLLYGPCVELVLRVAVLGVCHGSNFFT
jgi:hypothetical protein